MDDSSLYAGGHAGLRQFYRLVGRASPESRVVELQGVTASVVPATPERSVVNSVVYDTATNLEHALAELASEYERAGVLAWTVWVPADDARATALLADAGHVLDGDPAAMALELEMLDAPAPDDLDLEPEPRVATLAALNDRAYTYGGDHFARALNSMPGFHVHVARVGGQPACGLGTHDHEGDCSVTLVATWPEARGRGLARKLLTHALLEARERGCTTSSLQATRLGYPVYRRIGYRDLGPIQMWERRRPQP